MMIQRIRLAAEIECMLFGVSFEVLEKVQVLKIMETLRHEINDPEPFHQLISNIFIRMKCCTTVASHMSLFSDDDLSSKKSAPFLVS